MEFATYEDMKRVKEKMDGMEVSGRDIKLEVVKIKSRSRSRKRSRLVSFVEQLILICFIFDTNDNNVFLALQVAPRVEAEVLEARANREVVPSLEVVPKTRKKRSANRIAGLILRVDLQNRNASLRRTSLKSRKTSQKVGQQAKADPSHPKERSQPRSRKKPSLLIKSMERKSLPSANPQSRDNPMINHLPSLESRDLEVFRKNASAVEVLKRRARNRGVKSHEVDPRSQELLPESDPEADQVAERAKSHEAEVLTRSVLDLHRHPEVDPEAMGKNESWKSRERSRIILEAPTGPPQSIRSLTAKAPDRARGVCPAKLLETASILPTMATTVQTRTEQYFVLFILFGLVEFQSSPPAVSFHWLIFCHHLASLPNDDNIECQFVLRKLLLFKWKKSVELLSNYKSLNVYSTCYIHFFSVI